jgi:hypothetical protein
VTRLLTSAGALALLSLVAAAAAADEFDDFRIPAHHQLDWSASFGGIAGSASGDYQNAFGNGAGRGRSVGGNTLGRFSWLADSDPRLTSISVVYFATGTRTWNATESFLDQGPINSIRLQNNASARTASESWSLDASHRCYPWALPLGFTVGLASRGSYNQAWLHDNDWSDVTFAGGRTVSLGRRRTTDWRYDHVTSAIAGVGLGRVRDATPVYEIHVLEQRLLQTGALTRPLSSAARQQLAALFSLRGSYGSFRERPARFLWKEVERIVGEDGALAAGGLDAYSVLRAGEPVYGGAGSGRDGLPSSLIARLRGFFVGAVLADFHQQQIDRNDQSQFRQDVVNDTLQPPSDLTQSQRYEAHFDRVLAGPSVEFHRPIGDRWQFDATGKALFPTRKEDKGLLVNHSGSVTGVLADRWLASLFLTQSRSLSRHASPLGDVIDFDDWGWSYGLSWNYYLEDRLSLQFVISESQAKHGSYQYSSHQRSAGLNLGLTYRFLGRYQAPGILEPANIARGN